MNGGWGDIVLCLITFIYLLKKEELPLNLSNRGFIDGKRIFLESKKIYLNLFGKKIFGILK